MHYEWLALCAAQLWAMAALISVYPARQLGAFAFNRWRMICVTLMLGLMSLYTQGFATLNSGQLGQIALSGLIGIFIGDTAFYACLNRLGPRRAGVLFACHALFSALFGIWLFSEQLQGMRLGGALLVFAGVMVAILFGRRGERKLEQNVAPLWIGIVLGLIAALCQSAGTLLAKPVMSAGVDPVAASCTRMAVAALAHGLLHALGQPLTRAQHPLSGKVLLSIISNGFLAMGVGMTLFLLALRHGDVSMVAILSSTSPVMILPLLWLYTRERPRATAWLGALLVVTGTALVLTGHS